MRRAVFFLVGIFLFNLQVFAGEVDALLWRLQASKFEGLEFREPLFQKALEINPRHTEIHYQYAEELERAGRVNEAASEYGTHVEVNLEAGNTLDESVFVKLWGILVKQGRTQDAVNYLEEFINHRLADKKDLAERLNAFNMSAVEKTHPQVVAKVEALKNFNNDRKLNQALAMLENGRTEEAFSTFEKHVQVNPYNLDYYFDFYAALDKAGKPDVAARVREMIWQSDNTDAEKCAAIHRIETECRQ